MKKYIFAILFLFISSSALAVCQLKVINNIEDSTSQYYLQNLTVNGGSCIGGSCSNKLAYGSSVSFDNDGKSWSTVLTASVYKSADVNTGSLRVEMQNASSNCVPVNVYSDYCSTDPSSGKSDCQYIGHVQNGVVTLKLLKQ